MEAGSLGCRSMLLISGGGHKKACSADMLGLLAKNGGLAPGSSAVHCAYNPYFPCEDDQRAERESLRKKMASGLCSGLWLQIGSDVSRCSPFSLSLLRFVCASVNTGVSSLLRMRKGMKEQLMGIGEAFAPSLSIPLLHVMLTIFHICWPSVLQA